MTPILGLSPLLTTLAAIFIGIIAAARITRLVVADKFPASVKLRVWWDSHTEDSLWNPLLHCPWCFAPYAVALVALLAWAAEALDVPLAWWLIFGWLAASYAASWVVYHDED